MPLFDQTPLHEVLARSGAVFVEENGWMVAAHFGDAAAEYQAARQQAALFDLSCNGKVELAGPDALRFLHNLCTNNVVDLPPGGGCEAFLTTAKARVVAHILVGRFLHLGQDVVWLDFEPGQDEKVLGHLNHYLISEQVELVNRTRSLGLLRLLGPKTPEVLHKSLSDGATDLPLVHHRRIPLANGGCAHARRHDLLGLPGFDLFCETEATVSLWQSLVDAGARPAGSDTHEVLRVEAGLPRFGRDIDENRFVVEVGRIRQAICYTKGCFLGQEPIVMARDRGQVNRTLMGIKSEGTDPLPAGSRLFQAGTEAGQVTSSVYSLTLGQVIGLAYLRRGSQEPGTVLQAKPDRDGRTVVVASLPLLPPIPV